MQEIKQTDKKSGTGIRTHELKGKKVTDSNGKPIGTILEVILDPDTLEFDGIEVDNGFFGYDTFIGKKYVKTLSKEGATLNTDIMTDYKGMKVFDSRGKDVGTVKEIRTEKGTNSISAITVGTGILKNDTVFLKSDIKGVGESIILNVLVKADKIDEGIEYRQAMGEVSSYPQRRREMN